MLTTIVHSNSEHYQDPNWSKNGYSMMEEIRRQGKLCDITLMSNDHKFTAHRIVLAASIPYFNAMLLNDMIESKKEIIVINSIDSNALEQFINYSYNGMITINNENVQSLLIAANFFHLQNIKNACSDYIKKRISCNDALIIRQFAEQFMCRDLLNSVNRYINRHFMKIIATSEYLNLNYNDLVDLLCRDQLNVYSEEQIYEALMTWIKYDIDNRQEYLCDLLKLIRLPLITPTYLVDIISNEKLIKTNMLSRDLFDEALYYYLLPERRTTCKTFNLKPRCCHDQFGLIYAIGGLNSNGSSVCTVEVYDCIADKWRIAESMITNRSRVAVAVLQGKLYAIGGYCAERLAIVETFDPDSKTWKRVSPISKPKSALGSAALNNKLYVCGGYNGQSSDDTVEMYDPKTDKWTIVSPMKKHRSAAGVTAFNGMIFVAGGHDGYRIFDSVECYDTQKDCWTNVCAMNNKRCRLGLSALDNYLYAAGGYDSLNFLNTVECYNLQEDKWSYVSPMLVKRSRMGLVTCNFKLFAVGGYDGVCHLSSVEFYDPDKDQWTLVSSMVAHEGVVGVGVLPINVDLQPDNKDDDKCSIISNATISSGTSSSNNNQTKKENDQKQHALINSQSNSNSLNSINANNSTATTIAASSAATTTSTAPTLAQVQAQIRSKTNKHLLNYYSLIEDEDDEDQYQDLRNKMSLFN